MGLFSKKAPAPTIVLGEVSKSVLLSSCEILGAHLKHAHTILKESNVAAYFEAKVLPKVAMNATNPEKAMRAIVEDKVIGQLARDVLSAIKRGFTNVRGSTNG